MPARKYLYQNEIDGEQYEREAVDESAGAGDAGELVALGADGVLDDSIINAGLTGPEIVLKTGPDGLIDDAVMNAGLTGPDIVVKTGPTGRLDMAIMPVGLGIDITVLEASENLAAGNVVNVHYDGGAFKVRRADASNNRPADGFVQDAFAVGEMAAVYREGTNAGVSGLAGPRVFLATTPGQATTTAPTGAGVIQQQIGSPNSATSFYFSRGKPVHLVA